MTSREPAGGLFHERDIQGQGIKKEPVAVDGTLAQGDGIDVGALQGRVTRVETLRDLPHPVYGDAFFQEPVQGAPEAIQRHGHFIRVEMSHLAQGMHAGVGPARARHPDPAAQDGSQGPFDFPLDGSAASLDLPAAIERTVVFNVQSEVWQGVYLKMSLILDQLLFDLGEAATGETETNKNDKIDKIIKMRFIMVP